MRYVMMENKFGAEVVFDGDLMTDVHVGDHFAITVRTCPIVRHEYKITQRGLVSDAKGIDKDFVFCYIEPIREFVPHFID